MLRRRNMLLLLRLHRLRLQPPQPPHAVLRLARERPAGRGAQRKMLLTTMADDATKTEDLWHALRDELRAFLRSRVPSDSDADDLLQDVFVRVYENVDSLRRAGRVKS